MLSSMANATASTAARCTAEVIGTFILIFFGCGAVHTAVTTGATSGVLQVGLVWGIGVMIGAFTVGHVSGAHLNPAVTLALAVWGGFEKRLVLPYWAAQTIGAALAAIVLHFIFSGTIDAYELKEGIVRGEANSVVTAAMYGEYFKVSLPSAFLAEVIGTGVLAAAIFALTDSRNSGSPGSNLAPLFIGLCVAAIIAVIGPLTQSCLNPARDFGPRIVAFFAGWGSIAFPGPHGAVGTLAVYLFAPLLGAVLGGGIYTKILKPHGGM